MRTFIFLLVLFGTSPRGDLQAADSPRIVEIQAKKFEYIPSEVHLKLGEPVILRLKSLDRKHGFKVPELGLEAVVKGGETTDVALTPSKAGKFSFHCSVFCGSGHEGMAGTITVE